MIEKFTYLCKKCNFEELIKIRNFLLRTLSDFIKDEIMVNQLILVVDEAVTNLLEYSFEDKENPLIKIRIIFSKNQLTIEIYDNGKSFDIRNVKNINMNDYFKNFQKGGLGIQLIKKIIDDINYHPLNSKQKLNKLELIKKF